MFMPLSRVALRCLVVGPALAVLVACENGQTGGASVPETPKADYATETDHFAALQQAGLSGNYAGFAGHLKPQDPAAVVGALQQSFGGKPFDVYTQKSSRAGASHLRMVELRSTDGRLYLYLKLDQVPGGWSVAGYDLSRNRAAISAKL